jgi:hypothetical protein
MTNGIHDKLNARQPGTRPRLPDFLPSWPAGSVPGFEVDGAAVGLDIRSLSAWSWSSWTARVGTATAVLTTLTWSPLTRGGKATPPTVTSLMPLMVNVTVTLTPPLPDCESTPMMRGDTDAEAEPAAAMTDSAHSVTPLRWSWSSKDTAAVPGSVPRASGRLEVHNRSRSNLSAD